MSDQIRWSLDLRWQRPGLPNGFYGLKDCITMAKSDEPGYAPDWTDWGSQDRTPMQKAAISADKTAEVTATADVAQGEASFALQRTVPGLWESRMLPLPNIATVNYAPCYVPW